MEKMKHYQGAAMRLLKALLAAYIVTGGLLFCLRCSSTSCACPRPSST
ncbi:MAG: hypothetical protein V8Q40_09660 [Anaerosacchariphilus sp.]